MREFDFEDHTCLICSRTCKGRRSLGNHLTKTHHTSIREYVLHYYYDDVVPKCKCGCGEEVRWHKVLYRFNDYVNGHNEAGFKSKNFTFTKEQIESRNEKIRKAYEERGDEIKKKISKSVKIGLSSDSWLKQHVEKMNKLWSDDDWKEKQHISRIKSWQGEAGDVRREKVFTKEFGRKISKANMLRDIKRTSKAEKAFVEKLRKAFPHEKIVESFWLNIGDKHKCYDVYLPSQNCLIEFDGLYWHGLDRTTDFTRDQIHNMTNDLVKNSLAKEAKTSLLRVKEGEDFDDITTFDELVSKSYHIQSSSGEIILDGQFKFLNDRHALISREVLIHLNETEEGREFNEQELLPTLREFFQEYVRAHGFFYPSTKERIEDSLKKINLSTKEIVDDTVSVGGHAGMSYLKANFKSFWHVNDGPYESVFSDKSMDAVLRYRLGINNSKPYTYTLSNGESVSCHETFNIDISSVRTGFVVQRKAVSFFKPTTAANIYKHFLSDFVNPTVWDPSCGFGARLLGFASCFPLGTYIGNEPASMTFDDLQKLRKNLLSVLPSVTIRLNNDGSEIDDSMLEDGSLDLVFTSPPYFDREKYFNEKGQCWLDHGTIEEWTKNYLSPTIMKAYRSLKEGCRLVVNIDKKNSEIVRSVALSQGFKEEKTIYLPSRRDHFSRSAGVTETRSEPILVFKK